MTIANRYAASASIDTASTYRVGFPLTARTLPRSSSSPVPDVGLPIPVAAVLPTWPITSQRDPAGEPTHRKTFVQPVHLATERDAKMIPSAWKTRRDREVSHSRNAGVDTTLCDLLDVAALIHIESSRWPDIPAVDLYMSAWQIQFLAIKYARREVTKHDAEMWIVAGRAYLATMKEQRLRGAVHV